MLIFVFFYLLLASPWWPKPNVDPYGQQEKKAMIALARSRVFQNSPIEMFPGIDISTLEGTTEPPGNPITDKGGSIVKPKTILRASPVKPEDFPDKKEADIKAYNDAVNRYNDEKSRVDGYARMYQVLEQAVPLFYDAGQVDSDQFGNYVNALNQAVQGRQGSGAAVNLHNVKVNDDSWSNAPYDLTGEASTKEDVKKIMEKLPKSKAKITRQTKNLIVYLKTVMAPKPGGGKYAVPGGFFSDTLGKNSVKEEIVLGVFQFIKADLAQSQANSNNPQPDQAGGVLNSAIAENSAIDGHTAVLGGMMNALKSSKGCNGGARSRRSLVQRAVGCPRPTTSAPTKKDAVILKDVKPAIGGKECDTVCSRQHAKPVSSKVKQAVNAIRKLVPDVKKPENNPDGKTIGEELIAGAGDGVSSIATAIHMISAELDNLDFDALDSSGQMAVKNFVFMIGQELETMQVTEENFLEMDAMAHAYNNHAGKVGKNVMRLRNFNLKPINRRDLINKMIREIKEKTQDERINEQGDMNRPESVFDGANSEGEVFDGLMDALGEANLDDADLPNTRQFIVYERASLSQDTNSNSQESAVNSDILVMGYNENFAYDPIVVSNDVASDNQLLTHHFMDSLRSLKAISDSPDILPDGDPEIDSEGNARPEDFIRGAKTMGEVFGKFSGIMNRQNLQTKQNLIRYKKIMRNSLKQRDILRKALQDKLNNNEQVHPDDVNDHDTVSRFVDSMSGKPVDTSSVEGYTLVGGSEDPPSTPLVTSAEQPGDLKGNAAGSISKPTITPKDISGKQPRRLSMRKSMSGIKRPLMRNRPVSAGGSITRNK